MHRLDGEGHAGVMRQRKKLLKSLNEQAAGMGPGVSAAAAAVDYEHGGSQRVCRLNRLLCVVDALRKGPAVAAGEATGPLEARHPYSGLGQQRRGSMLADIRKLHPPQRQAVESVCGKPGDLLGEFPARHCQLTEGHMKHARIFSRTISSAERHPP